MSETVATTTPERTERTYSPDEYAAAYHWQFRLSPSDRREYTARARRLVAAYTPPAGITPIPVAEHAMLLAFADRFHWRSQDWRR